MERKLATIQRIKSLDPVITRTGEEALRLRLASFEDVAWQCVVGADQFEVGAECIYIEVSCVVPEVPVFEFMRKDKFIVKTKKFVGTTLSQGLAMPLAILWDFTDSLLVFMNLEVGDDVAHVLGVKRFDPVEQYGTHGPAAGAFPTDIVPKTDEIRVQSSPLYLEKMRGLHCTATMKLDGTSATYWFADDKLHTASRNLELKEDYNTVYWRVAEKYELAKKLASYHTWVIQGEIVGPGIQRNPLALKSPEFYIFNIWDMQKGDYVDQDTLELFGRMINLPTVPIVKRWTEFNATIPELLQVADGTYPGTPNPMEGIVVRPTFVNMYDARLGRLSFKVINDKFALKENFDD